MKLSVIIVNYNVEFFLEQCLLSVQKAMANLDGEVFVVDNNSVDGSVALVKEKFPWVKLMVNPDNPGFSKANNQAIIQSSGEYLLLLNPDTVVQEDTFVKVIRFMDEHPLAGGLGVKMVDGKGNFLPESKRGLPTPEVSFYKISGIHKLFPRSKKFNRYYMGHLDKSQVQEIEILSGAFMLMRKLVLDEVGLLDEAFFMYGEDIDLSWRIVQGGYKNFYFPETSIIHYKGESTKKGSLNYVFVFYHAMLIFARKHFSEKHAAAFSLLINFAIYFRAGISVVQRFMNKIWLPLLDFVLIVLGLFGVKLIYESVQHKIYDLDLVMWAFAGYALLWQWTLYMNGAYDKSIRLLKILKGVAVGTGFILAIYALLPESLRFSRALILLGTLVVLTEYALVRGVMQFLDPNFSLSKKRSKRIVVVGKQEEATRVSDLLKEIEFDGGELIRIDPSSKEAGNLGDLVRVYNIEEVVFCAKDMTSGEIIARMSGLDNPKVEFKIAPPESMYIIGSNSIHTSADIFIMDINSVSRLENRRKKRLLDFLVSLCLIISLPITLFLVKKGALFLRNLYDVLLGKKTWVGFYSAAGGMHKLPNLRPGVLTPVFPGTLESLKAEHEETVRKLNVLYAKDYRVMNDLNIIFKSFPYLGQ